MVVEKVLWVWEGIEKKRGSIPLRWRLEIDRLLNEMRKSPHFGEVRTMGDGGKAVKKIRHCTLHPTEFKPRSKTQKAIM